MHTFEIKRRGVMYRGIKLVLFLGLCVAGQLLSMQKKEARCDVSYYFLVIDNIVHNDLKIEACSRQKQGKVVDLTWNIGKDVRVTAAVNKAHIRELNQLFARARKSKDKEMAIYRHNTTKVVTTVCPLFTAESVKFFVESHVIEAGQEIRSAL